MGISLFFIVQGGCSKEPAANIGDAAKDFTLSGLAGEEITLSHFFPCSWTGMPVYQEKRRYNKWVNNVILISSNFIRPLKNAERNRV